jgi:hypothetical protein
MSFRNLLSNLVVSLAQLNHSVEGILDKMLLITIIVWLCYMLMNVYMYKAMGITLI